MVKRFLMMLLALWSLGAMAQLRVSPYLALGGRSVYLHDRLDELDAGSAFRVGVGCYVPLGEEETSFYLVPELSYSSFKFSDHAYLTSSQTFRYSQLHLPVVADYRLNFNGLATLDVGVGPFVSFGLGGSAIGRDHFGRWNTGVAFRASVRLIIFTVGLSYDLGLVDMQRLDDGERETLSMLGLSFGLGF